IRAEIIRVYLPEETLSTLNVLDDDDKIVFACKGLEPPNKGNQHNISCIPEGVYPVEKEETSTHHEYPHFRVGKVPHRAGILWHAGNYFSDTLGCYIVGDGFGDRNKDDVLDVLNSRATLAKLYELLPAKFEVTYKKKK